MIVASTVLAQQMMRDGGRMDWDNGASWAMVVTMIVLAIAAIAVVVWAVVYASRRSHGPGAGVPGAPVAGPPTGPTAREILDARYARGEIDSADYEERRAKLT